MTLLPPSWILRVLYQKGIRLSKRIEKGRLRADGFEFSFSFGEADIGLDRIKVLPPGTAASGVHPRRI